MASPQAENGHTDIAHEILEKLAQMPLSGAEFRILMVVFRRTYGWHKSEDIISLTQFQEATGFPRWTAWDAIERLVRKSLLVRISLLSGSIYRFNKDWETWGGSKEILTSKEKLTSASKEKLTSASKEKPTKLVRKSLLETPPKRNTAKVSREAKLIKEKYKEKYKEIDRWRSSREEVISHLNQVLGSGYKPHSNSTRKPLDARLNEGFSIEDCKRINSDRVRRWKGTSQEEYLRPETLYGGKFEGYLQAALLAQGKQPEEDLSYLEEKARQIPVKPLWTEEEDGNGG